MAIVEPVGGHGRFVEACYTGQETYHFCYVDMYIFIALSHPFHCMVLLILAGIARRIVRKVPCACYQYDGTKEFGLSHSREERLQ